MLRRIRRSWSVRIMSGHVLSLRCKLGECSVCRHYGQSKQGRSLGTCRTAPKSPCDDSSLRSAIMPPLNTFPLPLTSGAPPDGYGWPEHDSVSSASRTSAFESGINQRDRFLGKRRCLVCGISDHFYLAHCLIVKEFSTVRKVSQTSF